MRLYCFFCTDFKCIFLRSYQQTSSGSGTYFPTIVLDAGHGGMDSGAVGIDNVLEKDINLSIALNLKDLFNISGFNVKMTREKMSRYIMKIPGLYARKRFLT